ncbi:hypothetical protein GOBAR_DD24542 [Gossypium barbadense]|nr:hypothetical protein GOBAR_DD24542 [Gossypium barbadense]
MKERISAKNVGRCGRRISRLFYKFSNSTNPIKFTEIKLVDDKDVKTMVTLYCQNQSEKHGVQDLCTIVPRAYVDRLSTVHGINIDLNAPPKSENLNSSPHFQIQFVMIETNANSDDGYDNNGSSNYEVEVENPNRGIVIRNDLGAHMMIIDPNATHESEFLEYP